MFLHLWSVSNPMIASFSCHAGADSLSILLIKPSSLVGALGTESFGVNAVPYSPTSRPSTAKLFKVLSRLELEHCGYPRVCESLNLAALRQPTTSTGLVDRRE
jgi:hypothetical protein